MSDYEQFTERLGRMAHNAVYRAIKAGRLLPIDEMDCAHCGGQAHEYHHQSGYAAQHRLDVIPLCRTCHGKERVKAEPYQGRYEQCQAISKRTGDRCSLYAMEDSPYCGAHTLQAKSIQDYE